MVPHWLAAIIIPNYMRVLSSVTPDPRHFHQAYAMGWGAAARFAFPAGNSEFAQAPDITSFTGMAFSASVLASSTWF
jgi:hypothetical protein